MKPKKIISLIIFCFLLIACKSEKKEIKTAQKGTIKKESPEKTTASVTSKETTDPWIGRYAYASDWEGMDGHNQVVVKGTLTLSVRIRAVRNGYSISYDHWMNPPGRLLGFVTRDVEVKKEGLFFTFTDTWGSEGKGHFKNLGGGFFEASITLVKPDPDSPVNHLYGTLELLKLKFDDSDKDVSSSFYNEKAEEFYRQKKYDKAVAILDLITDLYPADDRASGNYAITLIRQKQLDKAEKAIKKLLLITKKNSAMASSYFNLGLIYEEKKLPGTAKEFYVLSNYLRPLKTVREKILKLGGQSDLLHRQETDERFKVEDHTPLANWVDEGENQLTPEEILQVYYREQFVFEGNEKISTDSKWLNDFIVEATLIYDELKDDSVKGYKYVSQMALINDEWSVFSLKSNHKCWHGRGNVHWDTDDCR